MSRTIDQRVVEMQFDNRHFEKNVQTSLNTLDKLKQSLNLKGASDGLTNLNNAASRFNMAGVSSAVETVQAKFSALQVMGVTALANITNSAVNAGKKITSALTIDPIKTGMAEYETQINAVQTILANTKHKGTTIDDVNSALDELNSYADKTIYNFTEMTRNIGTFTAAGVDLDKSVTSIKGIANLAAVSGSTSQQASTAMYQLSQALAAGKVSLMDWNSVVNAGMGGEVFQNALKRTAENMGKNVDAMIEKYGSFRESLTQGEWLTADVLTETLTQLSGAYTEADLIAQGYSKKQAKEILELAKTAEGAATDVKTFTQLLDTTKEALQSGWTQTWETIIGDFEEAKKLWSGVSKILNEFISASSEARNNLVQGWADGGGREMAIEAISNAFNGLLNILRPIKEAFREVFPPATADQLIEITKKIRDMTEKFRESTEDTEKIKNTFKGVFSIVKMGFDVITTLGGGILKIAGALTGLGGGLLTVTGSFGEWISKLTSSMSVTEAMSKGFETVATYIEKFVSFVGSNFAAPGYEGFLGLMTSLWNVIQKIGSKVAEVGAGLGDALAEVFSLDNIGAGLDIVNGGIFAAILLNIKNFMKNITEPFKTAGGFLENVGDILDGVKGSLEAYQQSLKANTLLKIAGAIAILAAAIVAIALIDPEKLAASLGAVTVLFADLIASMALFNTIGGAYPKAMKAIGVMLAISTSVLILATALKQVSDLNLGQIMTGLVGVLGLTAIIVGAAKVMASGGKIVIKGASQMILMAVALKVLASVCEDMAQFSWDELGKGLTGMVVMMGSLVASMKLLSGSKFGASTGASMILLATSMKIVASAVKDFSTMKWGELGRGLAAMAGALAAITIAMKLLPKNMVGSGVGLIVVASALLVLSNALDQMSGMTWDEIGKSMAALGGSMLILALGLKAMTGTITGSAALLVAVSALTLLAPVLRTLGSMSWTEIAKGLIAIAGAFAILGIAGALLTPLVPAILALSGSLLLLGAACLAIGGGLALIATGITSLAVAGTAGATAIVASITAIVLGIVGLIPALAGAFGEAIVVFCTVIGNSAKALGEALKAVVLTLVDVLVECVPALADGALKLITGVLEALVVYSPQIIDYLFQFIINVLNGLAERMPDLIQAAVNVFVEFFAGITEALANVDTSSLVNAIVGVGLLSALMLALSAIASLIPAAMVGVLGLGVLVAELALVLAAIGAFAQIPGLSWLINEGGNFLQTIGNAIGKFVGGIVGGIAEGVTSSLPQIATDLSNFMNNLQPFIEGAKGIDAAMIDGVKSLAEAILILTAADILDGITSWITGGSSLTDFAEQLVPFGESLKSYSDKVAEVDAVAITASITAAKQLVKLADIIPNSGGLASLFAGDNDLSDFGDKMVSFGKDIASYSKAVAEISISAINNSISAAKNLVAFISSLEGFNASGVASFKNALSTLGKTSVDEFIKSFSGASSKLLVAGKDMIKAVSEGVRSNQLAATKAIDDTLNKMSMAIKSKHQTFYNAGKEVISKFDTGVIGANSKSTKTIGNMLNDMVTKIRNKYQSFYNAGGYLVSGFANGISANSYKAAAKSRAMAAAAADAARKELDEHSPSRVGYKIGDFFGLAFVNAIGEYASKAYDVSTEMARSARAGLNDAIDRITMGIDSNLDIQPTIRPILDLSNVKSGASHLNGLFGDRALAGVGSIGATMSLRNQNGVNSDVISAIDKLRGDLKNVGGSSITIGGITYDDGSAVSDAVRTLVRAAKIERRA